ncbi:Hint domain-containing protein [Octadecabacter sp. 1_MG-2023]|uniref:Hint domain-containing protein n=1 Tax=unclassified Octadecabacter TaxID=196158 RepID=UPI001C0976A2|nr:MULTISPECIES: Hint domain-containing protein [unclassified Octadecabacter]MBU2992458.1 Hint domain-containing protein [Octadecabacter sp. B2R22]MDO6734786.1 Hint domain-containing protein [Octadecabacter sp. 1_MG-2023]
MTLNWIGTRTQEGGDFNPAGLGCARSGNGSLSELLTRGSLLMEVTVRPSPHPVNLLRFAALDPWPSGITVCLEPDGTLRLMMRQGGKHLATSLKTKLGAKVQTAHITYTWDAPARSGRFSVYIPDHGILWQTSVMSPFPISTRDTQRIVMAPESCAMDKDVTFAAVANAPCPHGPMPGLSGSAAVDTTSGPKALRDIVAGDCVTVDGTEAVRVLWAGHASLPALGRFAPMTLRRPYMGLWEDLIAARDQRACLAGSEVEYMFGEERVSTAIRHLEVRNCATPTKNAPAIVTYYQVLLETHEIITVNGAMVESFDGSAVLSAPDFLKFSVLADMPIERCPKNIGLAAPVLQGYEALTLTGVSIG